MALPQPRTLRTKRNFKALQLPTTSSPSNHSSVSPSPNTTAPSRPLPSIPTASGLPLPSALNPLKPLPPTGDTPVTSQQRSAIRATISETIAGHPPRKALDVQNEKLIHIREIGQGNGGSVSLVRHKDTGIVMAKKIVLIDAKPSVRKQIVRELQIMHECDSPYIIECYGSFLADPNICICMEYMDKRSFDGIYKKIGPIRIEVVARVALSVLEGLTYLYDVHRMIHRDIKPSNILCNARGEIKLCDFGVSGELINSIANTFVGTSIYMSPERIQGAEYSVKSDIWSLGITLVELATGHFPFSGDGDDMGDDLDLSRSRLPDLDEESSESLSLNMDGLSLATHIQHSDSTTTGPTPNHKDTFLTSTQLRATHLKRQSQGHTRRRSHGVSLHGGGMTMSIIELMHHIVREPAPRLVAGIRHLPRSSTTEASAVDEAMGPRPSVPPEAEAFVDACVEKEVERRGTPGTLLTYKWINDTREANFDVAKWAEGF